MRISPYYIKLFALCAVLMAAPFAWTDSLLAVYAIQRELPASSNFRWPWYSTIAVYVLVLLGLVAIPFLKSLIVRVTLSVLTMVSFVYDRTLYALGAVTNEDRIEYYDVLRLAWQQRANSWDALAAYGPASYAYVLLAAFYIVATALPNARTRQLPSVIGLTIPIAGVIAAYVAIQPYSQNRFYFPSPVHVPAYTYRVATVEIDYDGPRDEPVIAPTRSPAIRNIVLIVDESVRSDFLSLNNPVLDSTPDLDRLAASTGVNYGTSMSIANCSVASRHALRTGLRQADLPDAQDHVFHRPTFWQYAKAAGFTTIYLDPFRQQFAYHSYMNANEAKLINERYTFDPDPVFIDGSVADKLVELMEREDAKFILVEKYGVHFPHDGRGIPSEFRYEPAGIDKLPRKYTEPQAENVRQYLRALRWKTDEFFARIESVLKREDTVVVYTADHGQNMFDLAPWLQHCNSVERYTAKGEASVPLAVFSGSRGVMERLARQSEVWRGKTSMEDIFPTLLQFMGYGEADVMSAYGPSLLGRPPDRKRRFIMRDLDTGRMMDFD